MRHIRIAILYTILLSACAAPDVTSTGAPAEFPVSVPPENIEQGTALEPPVSENPPLTPSSTPDPTRLPPYEGYDMDLQIIFQHSLDAGCALPCWQGFDIGRIDTAQASRQVNTLLGISPSIDFFGDAFRGDPDVWSIPGYDYAHIWWEFDRDKSEADGYFSLNLYYDLENRLLGGIMLVGAVREGYPTYDLHTPARLIRTLGEPSAVRVYLDDRDTRQLPTDFEYLEVPVMYVYDEQGLISQFRQTLMRVVTESNETHLEYCLESSSIGVDVDDYFVGRIDRDAMTSLQTYVLRWNTLTGVNAQLGGRAKNPRDFEEIFGLSLSELTQRINKEEDVCLVSQFP